MRLAAVLALTLAPLAAAPQTSTAQTSTPAPSAEAAPAAPAPSPRWSIGAGVFSAGSDIILAPRLVYLGGYAPPAVPGVTASVERRVAERTWLVAGVTGSLSRTRQDVAPGSTGVSRDDVVQVALTGGARWIVTPARSPVALSVLALADAGLLDARIDNYEWSSVGTPGPARVTYDVTGWDVGASLGIALERELAGGLSLRLATPLVRASYTSTRTRVAGERLDGSDLAATLALAPSLELRLAF